MGSRHKSYIAARIPYYLSRSSDCFHLQESCAGAARVRTHHDLERSRFDHPLHVDIQHRERVGSQKKFDGPAPRADPQRGAEDACRENPPRNPRSFSRRSPSRVHGHNFRSFSNASLDSGSSRCLACRPPISWSTLSSSVICGRRMETR